MQNEKKYIKNKEKRKNNISFIVEQDQFCTSFVYRKCTKPLREKYLWEGTINANCLNVSKCWWRLGTGDAPGPALSPGTAQRGKRGGSADSYGQGRV